MALTDVLANLNPRQSEAVTAKPGHYLILAGAGSGKTRVLVRRIAWLLTECGVSPHAILAVTFTNKAAQEMLNRISELIGFSARIMWVGTFHGLAHRMLRMHWREAGLAENFQILDSDDQLRVVKRVMKDLEITDERFVPKKIQWQINGWKDQALRPDQIECFNDRILQVSVDIYRAYQRTCDRNSLLDFAELLLRSYELLVKDQTIREQYQQRFSHILVDEFQDTNAIQYAWLRLLAGKTNHLMMVGDDDQSIYGWRGAKIENLFKFCDDYPNVETIRLEQNYRSTNTILQAANALIKNNSERMGKDLWTDSGEGAPISVYTAFNDLDEVHYVVEMLKTHYQTRGRYQDLAILYRSNAQSRVFEESLVREGIPYRIYGGLRFFERAEIRDAMAYLRLVFNPHDDAAFERVINFPVRGIGERTVEILRGVARAEDISLWAAVTKAKEQGVINNRAATAIKVFTDIIENLQKTTAGKSLADQVELTIEHSGLLDEHRAEKTERSLARVENLQELVNAARNEVQEEDVTESVTLAQFLSRAVLDSGEVEATEFQDCVQLMTLHSAKGLEFPVVFITGIEEGLFPHEFSLSSGTGVEEERRLCYVGMTRAMQQLYLTYAEKRRFHGKDSYRSPSRFLREIPAQFLQPVRLYQERNTRPAATASVSHSIKEVSDCGYKLGQHVVHARFGEGVVLSIRGSGDKAQIVVNFKDVGEKTLAVAIAKLEPVN